METEMIIFIIMILLEGWQMRKIETVLRKIISMMMQENWRVRTILTEQVRQSSIQKTEVFVQFAFQMEERMSLFMMHLGILLKLLMKMERLNTNMIRAVNLFIKRMQLPVKKFSLNMMMLETELNFSVQIAKHNIHMVKKMK